MNPVYQFRPGSHVSKKLDAQSCGVFIESLHSRAPREIVEASRDKTAPTHSHFSWDITGNEAKMRVWEQEAGQLVRAILVYQDDQPASTALPAFVSIIKRDSDDRSYVPTYEALSDADYRSQVLDEAKSALFAWRRRYHDLEELARVFVAIDQLTLDEAIAA